MTAPAIVEVKTGPSMLVRAVWYVLVGWWLTGFVMGLAWVLAITIVGLPITFYLVNRIPTVLTLRPRAEQYELVTGTDGVTRYERLATEQYGLLVRLVWFLLVGWWASFFTMAIAWALIVLVITLPLGLMLFNRVPFVASLYRY